MMIFFLPFQVPLPNIGRSSLISHGFFLKITSEIPLPVGSVLHLVTGGPVGLSLLVVVVAVVALVHLSHFWLRGEPNVTAVLVVVLASTPTNTPLATLEQK